MEDRFLVVVGVGRDALSLAAVSERVKRVTGPLAYFAAGVPQLMRKPLPMHIEIDGRPLPHNDAWSVLVGNCGVVPGRITILPKANLQDGKLDLLHVAPRTVAGWLPIAIHGLRGTHRKVRGLADHQVEGVTIIPERATSVQIDGDVWRDVERVEIFVDPASLIIRGKALKSHGLQEDGERDSSTDSGLDQ